MGLIIGVNLSAHATNSHLLIDLIGVQCFPIGVSAGVKSAHKLIVVNETIAVQVKDVCHCVHLQRVCGKFYARGEDMIST